LTFFSEKPPHASTKFPVAHYTARFFLPSGVYVGGAHIFLHPALNPPTFQDASLDNRTSPWRGRNYHALADLGTDFVQQFDL